MNETSLGSQNEIAPGNTGLGIRRQLGSAVTDAPAIAVPALWTPTLDHSRVSRVRPPDTPSNRCRAAQQWKQTTIRGLSESRCIVACLKW